MDSQLFDKVGIFGVGLIGGSLGLALKRAFPEMQVLGLGRNPARLRLAFEMGAIDTFSTDAATLRDCDLVVLATPVEHILKTLEILGGYLAAGTVVTDAGSTKRRICRVAWTRLPSTVEFIGGHPIAGREVVGIEHSLVDLYLDAPYVLCPQHGVKSGNLKRLLSLAEGVGARPSVMTAEAHDRALAWVSHLPQLLSTALANVAGKGGAEIAGSGLKDMLRLAGSQYGVWKGILETNADNIDQALGSFIGHLEHLRAQLKANGLEGEFESAAEIYRGFRSPRPS